MLNYETLLSSYDDKLTLMQWLKKVEAALKDASASAFSVSTNEDGTINFKIEFEDGSSIESNSISLLNGDVTIEGDLEANNIKCNGLRVEGDIAALASLIGGVNTEAGKKYKVVACVLRNINGTWQQITTGNHAPINLLSVTQDNTGITINFNFTAKNVVSFVACPDEDFARLNYSIGASVGVEKAIIDVYRQLNIGGYFAYLSNGTWQTLGGIENVTFNSVSGVLTFDHPAAENCIGRFCSCRGGVYLPSIGDIGDTQDTIYIKNYDGSPLTSLNTDVRIYWGATGTQLMNPANVNQSGNIWCFGIFEVE